MIIHRYEAGMEMNIEVRWLKGVAAGYTDVFPVERFAEIVVGAEDTHIVRGPKSAEHTARYCESIVRISEDDRSLAVQAI
ncbi:MAG TPA: hypothetical protein VL069_07780 [Opitutus sp.]|nr:hypothetical protein [Opitutus sp.]